MKHPTRRQARTQARPPALGGVATATAHHPSLADVVLATGPHATRLQGEVAARLAQVGGSDARVKFAFCVAWPTVRRIDGDKRSLLRRFFDEDRYGVFGGDETTTEDFDRLYYRTMQELEADWLRPFGILGALPAEVLDNVGRLLTDAAAGALASTDRSSALAMRAEMQQRRRLRVPCFVCETAEGEGAQPPGPFAGCIVCKGAVGRDEPEIIVGDGECTRYLCKHVYHGACAASHVPLDDFHLRTALTFTEEQLAELVATSREALSRADSDPLIGRMLPGQAVVVIAFEDQIEGSDGPHALFLGRLINYAVLETFTISLAGTGDDRRVEVRLDNDSRRARAEFLRLFRLCSDLPVNFDDAPAEMPPLVQG